MVSIDVAATVAGDPQMVDMTKTATEDNVRVQLEDVIVAEKLVNVDVEDCLEGILYALAGNKYALRHIGKEVMIVVNQVVDSKSTYPKLKETCTALDTYLKDHSVDALRLLMKNVAKVQSQAHQVYNRLVAVEKDIGTVATFLAEKLDFDMSLIQSGSGGERKPLPGPKPAAERKPLPGPKPDGERIRLEELKVQMAQLEIEKLRLLAQQQRGGGRNSRR